METFEQVWVWISTALVVLIIPLVTSLIKDVDSERAKRWGLAKLILLRIFGASTTRSSKTGEAKASMPILGSAVHPDDRK